MTINQKSALGYANAAIVTGTRVHRVAGPRPRLYLDLPVEVDYRYFGDDPTYTRTDLTVCGRTVTGAAWAVGDDANAEHLIVATRTLPCKSCWGLMP